MLRKRIWLASLLVITSLLLAACPAPAAAPAGEEPAATATPAASEAMTETETMTETEASTTTAASGDCAPATEGDLAGVDPSGQAIVWWHNHTGSREEGLVALLDEFNQGNPCGITIEAQSQGSYNDIRDKVNASISAGELPCWW